MAGKTGHFREWWSGGGPFFPGSFVVAGLASAAGYRAMRGF
jgi:hypothetical protein